MSKSKKDLHEDNQNQDEQAEEIKIKSQSEDADSKSDEKIEKLEKEIQEYKDRLLRKAAEFENYKRRTENDQLNLLKYAAESFIVKLLPTVDDFERSLKHMENAQDVNSIKEGIKLVYDKFMKVLKDQGVTKIESVGKPFDVDYHEAMMQRKEEGAEPHTVLDEIETGYMYKDKVIRHAKVIVSEDSDHEAADKGNDNANINSEEK